uniref:Peptidase C39-like protein n=1 Tax=uncultured bacterium RM57 TaxID=561246 RepID=C8XT90_9BACT|nr:peptidase C39-like protein [uncultured bacterium RM57]
MALIVSFGCIFDARRKTVRAGDGMLFFVQCRPLLATLVLVLLAADGFAQTAVPSTGTTSVSGQTQALEEMQHGKSADAIATLEKMAAEHPGQTGVEHDLGLAYYRAGKLVSARHTFESGTSSRKALRTSIGRPNIPTCMSMWTSPSPI